MILKPSRKNQRKNKTNKRIDYNVVNLDFQKQMKYQKHRCHIDFWVWCWMTKKRLKGILTSINKWCNGETLVISKITLVL